MCNIAYLSENFAPNLKSFVETFFGDWKIELDFKKDNETGYLKLVKNGEIVRLNYKLNGDKIWSGNNTILDKFGTFERKIS